MSEPSAAQAAPVRPTVEVAVIALRRIAVAWDLDRYDATSLVASDTGDFAAVEWSDDRLTRVGYLIDLDKALPWRQQCKSDCGDLAFGQRKTDLALDPWQRLVRINGRPGQRSLS